jgi:hypothetical protein
VSGKIDAVRARSERWLIRNALTNGQHSPIGVEKACQWVSVGFAVRIQPTPGNTTQFPKSDALLTRERTIIFFVV